MTLTKSSSGPGVAEPVSFGPRRLANGQWNFYLWARKPKTVDLLIQNGNRLRSFQMEKMSDGMFVAEVPAAESLKHGDEYCFRINQREKRPDPAARYYTSNVHGWCQLVDHDQYAWQTPDWKGVGKEGLAIYELHLGTFTQKGTFLAAIDRLDELKSLGITAIELLPVAQSPGKWNWGYDGVGLFAVENTYGTPDDLKQLVDACHQRGMAIIMDVVYNHLGPEGNYLSEFGPYFTRKHHTPWGSAWNFDDRHNGHVRQFMNANARMWIEDYRFDGLRLDAVHFMFDDSDRPMSIEIGETFDALRESTGRTLHLIGETNVHNGSLMKSSSPHGTGFDALWSDCLMHSVLGIAQPGLDLCHRVHHGAVDAAIGLHQGFIHENYPYERHDAGERADLHSFVVGMQNHDTVGNHPQGRRIHELGSKPFQAAAAALYLLYPAIPMLFMGEEFCCDHPFLFFVDFGDPRVNESVERGRATEFPEMKKMVGVSPLDPESFRRSKIGHAEDGDTRMWQWYQSLLGLRRRLQQADWIHKDRMEVECNVEAGLFQYHYQCDGGTVTVASRLVQPSEADGLEPVPVAAEADAKVLLWSESETREFDGKLGGNEAVVLMSGKR